MSLEKYCGVIPAFYACYDEQGSVSEYFARLMVILRSSSGWRSTSSVCLLNSVSSSQNKTPL